MSKFLGAAIALGLVLTFGPVIYSFGFNGNGNGATNPNALKVTTEPFETISVNTTPGLAAMIGAADFVAADADVNDANFTVAPEKHNLQFALIFFNRPVPSDRIVAEIEKRHWRAANLAECVAFAIYLSQKGGPMNDVECLGQAASINGTRFTPELTFDQKRNKELLGLSDWESSWDNVGTIETPLFLAVRD